MDPISNMLTSIRNTLSVGQPAVFIPFSKIKFEIAKILEREGLIERVEKKSKKQKNYSSSKKFIKVILKYTDDNLPVISGLKRISKPGQKIYLPYKKIKKVKEGYGLAIISTSKGLMTDKEARKNKLGGEVICEIW